MLKRPAIAFTCLALGAVLAFGLIHLFDLRMEQGDVYPPYSTLRSDPLGASVFFESLDRVPGVSAQRYFEETFKETEGPGRSLFILGTEASGSGMTWMPRSEFDNVRQFVNKGGRVVIAFFPRVTETWWGRRERTNDVHSPSSKTNTTEKADANGPVSDSDSSTNNVASKNSHGKNAKKDSSDSDDEETRQERLHFIDMSKKWGFEFTYNDLKKDEDGKVQFPNATMPSADSALPTVLPIHTALVFTNLHDGWKHIFERDNNQPVVVERKFGAGAVVLIADSYPFSNEAMFKDRNTSFLTWALGDGHRAIFDEAHLGVSEKPGVAALMRRYQLEGLAFSLVLVAGLFIWKNSRSLVPPYEEAESDAGPVVQGRDSASGFVNLVRRSVAPAEIINVCMAEWKLSRAKMSSVSAQQRRDIDQLVSQQAALEPRARNPIETYRRIAQILKNRK